MAFKIQDAWTETRFKSLNNAATTHRRADQFQKSDLWSFFLTPHLLKFPFILRAFARYSRRIRWLMPSRGLWPHLGDVWRGLEGVAAPALLGALAALCLPFFVSDFGVRGNSE